MTKRFELLSWNFQKLKGRIYDYQEDKTLYITLYETIDLLNEVSQSEYDLKSVGKEIQDKIDESENKRFYIKNNGIWDNTWKRRKPLTWKELCDTLNKFQELSIEDLELIEQLKKENEQLKKELKEIEEICDNYYEMRMKEL